MQQNEIKEALKLSRAPYPHQLEEWERSFDAQERLLWWEMGTGKTTAAIGWLRLKWRKYAALGDTLIIAPLATHGGWKREFELNAPPHVAEKFVIAAGFGKKKMPGKKRAELIAKDTSGIIVTNRASLLMPDVLEALRKKNFRYLVIDEIHEFKGYDSKGLKNLLPITDKIPFRLGLTGTLIANGYMDVWGPCRILDGGKRFGTNFYSHFRRKYFVDLNAGMAGHNYFPDWQPAPHCAEDVTDKLATLSSRKRKSECLKLPPRILMQEEVELGEDQAKAYMEMENELMVEVQAGTLTASNALVKMLRMRQILAGFMPITSEEDPDVKHVHYFKSNPRFDRLAELAEQITVDKKLVVWSNFRAMYPKFREMAQAQGRGFAELTGLTKDRQAEILRFQTDPNCKYFFANPQAGGTGVDGLQHVCDFALYYEISHSLLQYSQSRDRTHRGGSEVHTSVTEMHLVAPNTINVDIHQALIRKENFADNVLERLRLRYGGRSKAV